TGLSQYQARPCPSAPKVLEPARRQLGVTHRVLDVSMAQVGLKGPGIVAFVSQRDPAGVSQHVGMSLKAELGLDASTRHHASKAASRERRAPLGCEDERRLRFLLTLQLAQGPHLVATDGMGARHAFLGPTNVQHGMGEIHLIPAQVYKLGRPEAVAEGGKADGGTPITPAIVLGGIS